MSQHRVKACTYVRLTELLLIVAALLALSVSILNKDILRRTLKRAHVITTPDDPGLHFWVHRYSVWHLQHRHNASRRVVFRPIGAGLGDSIFGLVSLYGFAVLTNRLLLIDWLAPYPLVGLLSADAAAQYVYNRQSDENSSEPTHCRVSYSYRTLLSVEMRALLKGPERTVYLCIGPLQSVTKLIPELRADKWNGTHIPPFSIPIQRAVAKRLLAPSDEVLRIVRDANEKFGFAPRSRIASVSGTSPQQWPPRGNFNARKPYISVHVRLGIGTDEMHYSRFSRLPGREVETANCFARQMRNISRGMRDPSPKVFLATDTPHFRAVFKHAVRREMPSAEVYYLNRPVRHVKKIPRGSKEGWEMYLMQHAEMLLIGNAAHIVSFRSGFPRAGFYRGTALTYKQISHGSCWRKR